MADECMSFLVCKELVESVLLLLRFFFVGFCAASQRDENVNSE